MEMESSVTGAWSLEEGAHLGGGTWSREQKAAPLWGLGRGQVSGLVGGWRGANFYWLRQHFRKAAWDSLGEHPECHRLGERLGWG